MKHRQGACPKCKIAWTWNLNITLRDQRCKVCGGPLTLIRRRETEDMKKAGFAWLSWEGYTV